MGSVTPCSCSGGWAQGAPSKADSVGWGREGKGETSQPRTWQTHFSQVTKVTTAWTVSSTLGEMALHLCGLAPPNPQHQPNHEANIRHNSWRHILQAPDSSVRSRSSKTRKVRDCHSPEEPAQWEDRKCPTGSPGTEKGACGKPKRDRTRVPESEAHG